MIHRYYAPDVGAYPRMLQIMARHFVDQGHQVTVFSTQPGYNDVVSGRLPRRMISHGVEEIRVPVLKEQKKNLLNRAINVLLFLVQLVLHCLTRFRTYDLMTVASFPPTVAAMTVRWLSWLSGNRYLYHCQDIYPEIALASELGVRPWLVKVATAIDRRNCRRADTIVTLSDDMRQTLVRRGLSSDNMRVINNFVIDHFDPSVAIDPSLERSDGQFRVLFAGNLGRFQNLDQLMEAARQLADVNEIQFHFVGAGVLETRLKQSAAEAGILGKTVFFQPFKPLDEVMQIIHHSHLSVVSLAPGIIECAYPSKTMTYLESGCRILGLIEPDCELARMIVDNGVGSVCESMAADGIVNAIRREHVQWETRTTDSERIRSVGQKLFSKQMILEKWCGLLEGLEGTNQPASMQTETVEGVAP